MKPIAQGAEAILYKDNDQVIKERFSKRYRHSYLDESLRKFRTRREAKILGKLEEMNFPAPHLQDFSDSRMSITMDFIPGKRVKEILQTKENPSRLAKEIGEKVGRLHIKDIIHGDLTTSNFIEHQKTGEVTFIDFGLSFFSDKVEDKAVDLFLLDRSLESTHYNLYPEVFGKVIEGYKESNPEAEKVLERFKVVKGRGRNKGKE
ncbi:Kae1-associated serine/threonine protein kinase [Candidatus Woesearchaeota archaeon]|nr:Kae1-associated serine/threonine protein kinase [Candidatus Woesearchaeota archaeon]